MMERKHYIDNLRWSAIMLLFPFHAAQVWCGERGECSFYVWSHRDTAMYLFSNAVYPWFMTLLFVLAGMSFKYSMGRRTIKQFIGERVRKLLVPMVFGVLFLVPIMTYIGELWFNGYEGTYLGQYVLFFTKPTDLTGYRGGFTPGHLWFLLYLFIISLVSLGIVKVQEKLIPEPEKMKIPNFITMLLFIPEWLCSYILDIDGKSIGQFMFLYLEGYYVITREDVLSDIKKFRYIELTAWLISGAAYLYTYCIAGMEGEWIKGVYMLFGWMGILTLLGFGQVYFDKSSRLTKYMIGASFPVYILHMPVLTVTAYFVMKLKQGVAVKFLMITVISCIATFVLYETVRRVPVLRSMFGISVKKKNG